ncbi:MAG: TetR/AcrR family transcriptional regulator [Anaerolineaceae bacterium]|nr:TetR/AcrR family transcriptional regulator [Anaerolineaceae bacterium]
MTHSISPEPVQEDTRQRLINAALTLFGQSGFNQTSTRAIAEAAGVNEVTLFRHFGSKKNLLMACIENKNAAGFAANFERSLTGDYARDIEIMAHLQIQNTSEGLDVLSLLICDSRNVPELRAMMLAGGQGNMRLVANYFQRQIDAGVVRKDLPAEVLAAAFDSLFSSPVIFEHIFSGSLSPATASGANIAPLVDLFVRGSRA